MTATLNLIVFLTNAPTLFENENLVLEMIRAVASAYIIKSSSAEEILSAIKKVSEGIPYYHNLIAGKLAAGDNKKIQ